MGCSPIPNLYNLGNNINTDSVNGEDINFNLCDDSGTQNTEFRHHQNNKNSFSLDNSAPSSHINSNSKNLQANSIPVLEVVSDCQYQITKSNGLGVENKSMIENNMEPQNASNKIKNKIR